MMKKIILMAIASAFLLAPVASVADSDDWGFAKWWQVNKNRCANSGQGNDAEYFFFLCAQNVTQLGADEESWGEADPGEDPE